MKTVNVQAIRKWNPCYDPATYKGEQWTGNAIDIFAIPEIPVNDKFWIVLREDLLDKTVLQEFATWCADQVRHLDTGRDFKAIPEETEERLALSAIHHASHGQAFEAARNAALVLKDVERVRQINKLLELIHKD